MLLVFAHRSGCVELSGFNTITPKIKVNVLPRGYTVRPRVPTPGIKIKISNFSVKVYVSSRIDLGLDRSGVGLNLVAPSEHIQSALWNTLSLPWPSFITESGDEHRDINWFLLCDGRPLLLCRQRRGILWLDKIERKKRWRVPREC